MDRPDNPTNDPPGAGTSGFVEYPYGPYSGDWSWPQGLSLPPQPPPRTVPNTADIQRTVEEAVQRAVATAIPMIINQLHPGLGSTDQITAPPVQGSSSGTGAGSSAQASPPVAEAQAQSGQQQPSPPSTATATQLRAPPEMRLIDGTPTIMGTGSRPLSSSSNAASNHTLQPGPFRLSPSLPPLPPKLVSKVQGLQFVDLKEFLPDNIKLGRRLEALDRPSGSSLAPNQRPVFREVNSMLSWAYTYTQYVAVLAESHPHLVRSRLAYMCLLIHEGRKCGGRGWIDYDNLFRQHAAAAALEGPESNQPDWSRVDPSLHSSCLISRRDSEGLLCTSCGGSDHPTQSCALKPLLTPPPNEQPSSSAPYRPPKGRPRPSLGNTPLCIQWNRGECKHPNCRYRHSCATCSGTHRASECPSTPRDSFFKRGSGSSQATPIIPSAPR